MFYTSILHTETDITICGRVGMSSEENEWSNTFDICRNRWLNNGEKVCQSIICAAECDDRKDKGKRQNGFTGSETDRWRESGRQQRGGRDRLSCDKVVKQVRLTEGGLEGDLRSTFENTGSWRWEGNGMVPLLLTSPCEWPPSFAVSLPKFHWAQRWSFRIPEQRKCEVNITTVFAAPLWRKDQQGISLKSTTDKWASGHFYILFVSQVVKLLKKCVCIRRIMLKVLLCGEITNRNFC